jgi:hypothetical protein
MKIRLWRVLSGRILVRALDIQYNFRKRLPLDATRSTPVREEESKGKASCPEKRASRCN